MRGSTMEKDGLQYKLYKHFVNECDICREEFESYKINGLGCCGIKYCNNCYDNVVGLPKCTVCNKENRHYKSQGKTVDELISSKFPEYIGFTSEITYGFDWFKGEFKNACDKNKDDRFDNLINTINLIVDDQEHSHNIVKDFNFIVEVVNDDDDSNVEINYNLVVNEKIFTIKSVDAALGATACERQYMVLGGIVSSFKSAGYNDVFRTIEALLT